MSSGVPLTRLGKEEQESTCHGWARVRSNALRRGRCLNLHLLLGALLLRQAWAGGHDDRGNGPRLGHTGGQAPPETGRRMLVPPWLNVSPAWACGA